MKKVLALVLVLAMVLAAGMTAAETAKTEVIVFAAASLTESLTEIKALYEAENPDIELVFNFDSSGTLKTQIQEGATCWKTKWRWWCRKAIRRGSKALTPWRRC